MEAERWAAEFHDTYESFAPQFGYETRTDSAVRWSDVPEANRRLMIATMKFLLPKILDPQAKRIAELKGALLKLANEADGLRAFEPAVREAIGNTNWGCLRGRVLGARDVLDKLEKT